jgi:hypothetical protein
MGTMRESKEGRPTIGADENDAATLASVTSIRTTSWNKFFAAERNSPRPALSGLDNDAGFIYKLGQGEIPSGLNRHLLRDPGKNMNFFRLATTCELDQTRFPRIKRKIPADTNVLTGVEITATLTNQNITGQNKLAIRTFDPQTLGLGVTTITGGTHPFFMCHDRTPSITCF